MKKSLKWLVVVGGVAVLAAVFYLESVKGTEVETATVKTGSIRTYAESRARTTLPRVHRVTMPLDGRVEAIALEEGAAVKEGQVVARLDTADLDTEVEVARARLAQIQARIALNQNNDLENTALKESDRFIDATKEAAKASQATVEAAKAEMDFAQWWYDAAKELQRGQAMAQAKLREARKEYVQAKVKLASDQFISSAVEAVKEAVELGPKYVSQWINRKSLKRAVLLEQEKEAEALLAKARRDRERASMKSPVDGVVLKRYVENERVLEAGSRLLDLGRLEDLEITADLLSEDAVEVRPGQTADIYGPAIGTDPLHGKVTRIKPEGFTKVSSLGVEQQRVAVIVAFDDKELESLKASGRGLGLGYRVRVRIYTGQKEKTLVAPRTALFRGSGDRWQVFAVRDGKARLASVEVGLSNDREAEILSGLKEGDRVVVAPPKSLADGVKVSADEPRDKS